ncbi:MAG: alanine racemase [Candidatus Paceibacterota bacterium]
MISLLKKIFRRIRAKRFLYEPLVKIVLDGKALMHNYALFNTIQPGLRVAPVLKSNAYGHGLILIAQKLDKENVPFFVVDSYYEALILKNEGIISDILVIGYTRPEIIQNAKQKGIIFTIVSFDQLKEIANICTHKTRFHIKIDTGMHRQGIVLENILEAINSIRNNKNIYLEGVCSHLADADTKDSPQTQRQIEIWNEWGGRFQKEFSTIRYTHVEATAGILYADKIHANVARIGLGLYGIDSPSYQKGNLLPVLSMESIVVGIKHIQKGEKVGYNGTYVASQDMTIGVIPVGYFEGIPRGLSNKGYVKVKGEYCPIIGRVSMNMMSIDVSNVPNVVEGNGVEIISSRVDDKNSIIAMTHTSQIPYEILVALPEKIRRVWK